MRRRRWPGAGELGAHHWATGVVVRDVLGSGVVVVLVLVLGDSVVAGSDAPITQITVLLTLGAAAGGAMAAICAHLATRLSGHHRGGWISAALALYSLVAVPAATLGTTTLIGADAAIGAVRLGAHCLFVVLLLVTAWGPWPRGRWRPWPVLPMLSLLLLGLLVTVGGLASLRPDLAQAVTTSGPVRTVVAGVWLIAATTVALAGWVTRSSPLGRIGLGCVVIAVAHSVRVADGLPDVPLGLVFALLRLFGILVVLLGAAALLSQALDTLDDSQDQALAQLRLAQIGLDRAAERDHELRNGLAGLAGAADLLTPDLGPADPGSGGQGDVTSTLRGAMAFELARLDALLHRARPSGHREPRAVDQVLSDQVMLRRSVGMAVDLDVEGGLLTRTCPHVLAQVTANVLANCERHAEGAPVQIEASRRGDSILIQIADSGPGIPAGQEEAVFSRGGRGAHSEGDGLGLHLCRQLLEAEGGTIRVVPRQPGRSGCAVLIELPASPDTAPLSPPPAGARS